MSFFDHFSGSLDTALWGAITSGTGAVSVTDGCVQAAKTSATDGAAVYLKNQIDKAKAQIFAFSINMASGGNFGGIMITNDASTPVCESNTLFDPKFRIYVTVSTQSTVLGVAISYWNTSHVKQYWNDSTKAWTTTGTNAATVYTLGSFVEGFLETDPTLGWRVGLLWNGKTGTTWNFDQQGGNRRVTVLTDWVAWASLETTSSLWLLMGMPVTQSITNTWKMEWFRYADGTRSYAWANQKTAASGNYSVRPYWHYGDYYYVPMDRSTDAIAADARVPFVLRDDDGTYAMVYLTSGTGIKLATASSPTGTWTVSGTIVANPGTTNRNTVVDASLYRDNGEADPAKRYKLFVTGLTSGPPFSWRIFYYYAATLTGSYTAYDNGGGADGSFILGPGSSGDTDEQGCSIPRVHQLSDGTFQMRYSGGKDSGSILQCHPCIATSPNLTNGGTWTKSGTNPMTLPDDIYNDITANFSGLTATVTSTTGFDADSVVIIGQDTGTADNYSLGRVRKVVSSTQVELYSQLVGFTTTTPARIRQLDSAPRLDFNAVEWSAALSKWVAIATSYQFFNYDGSLKGFCETTSLWTADDLAGPWTVSPIDGQPIPHTYFSGQRSAENPAVIVTSFRGLLLPKLMAQGLFVGSII